MVIMLVGCTPDEQCSFVRFFVGKRTLQRIFINKYFLTAGLRNSHKDVRKSQVMPDRVALVQKWLRLLCCGFRGKAMGQVYQCWWRIYWERIFFFRFEYYIFYVLYPFVTCLLTLPRTLLPVFLFSVVFQNSHFDDFGYVANTMTNSRSCIRCSIA
jgi:hypothetical protein